MKYHRIKTAAAAAAVTMVFLLSAVFTDCSLTSFISRSSHLTDIVCKMFPPDTGFAKRIISPLIDTISMSVTGTFSGALLALLAAPLCAGNMKNTAGIRWALRLIIQILRSFPALILALLTTFLFGLGTFSGSLAIGIFTFAVMTRLTYEDIEGITLKPYEALASMGAGRGRAYIRAVIPEIAPSFLSNALYLLETNVRHSSILGYVGAGGIGLLLNEKISWTEYDKVGMILIMLFLAVCIIETASSVLGKIVRGEMRAGKTTKQAILIIAAAVFIFCTIGIAPPDMSRTSLKAVRSMLMGFMQPDMVFFLRSDSGGLAYLILETVCISVVGTVLGAFAALPLSILGSEKLVPGPAAVISRILIMMIRSVPFFVYGLIFIRVSGPGAFTGVLTLAVCSIGLLSKRFIQALEALDMRPFKALASMGTPISSCIRYAVMPQLKPALLSSVLYRFDVNIREASVLGLVGAGGIGAPLVFAMNHYSWNTAGAICLGLVILVWIIDVASAYLRKCIAR